MNHTPSPDATPAMLWPDKEIVTATVEVARRSPLVHCLTNVVAATSSANALLAVGASPAMVENPAEAAEFAAVSDAVLINLGTMSTERSAAARQAAAAAHSAGTPWVLDPVAVGVLAERTHLANELLTHSPTIIRGNASEIMSLVGASSGGRGVDSVSDSSDALAAAVELARRGGAIVAVSGVIDYVTDGDRTISIPGGDPMLTRVTATGCMLGALIAAFAAVCDSPLVAAAGASALLAAAGERSARRTSGPGSFAVSLLDDLYTLSDHSQGVT